MTGGSGSIPASSQARWAIGLASLAVWAVAVPWLAASIGLELDVATRLEIADHVIPGVVMLVGAAILAVRGGPPGSVVWIGAGAVAFLTGLWITATHVPLVPAALEGVAPWGAALLHLSAGPPILGLGLWMLVRSQLYGSAP